VSQFNNPLKKSFWKNLLDKKIGRTIDMFAYIKQSLMAIITMLCFFFAWNYFIPIQNQVIFSAIASSTFLTFISTSIYDSLSRKIIGGQTVGILVGLSLWYIMHHLYDLFPSYHNEIFMLFLSLSAGVAFFFMAIFNFEHPPVAGTAMAFVFKPITPIFADILFIIVCSCLLALIHHFIKKNKLIEDLEGRDLRTKVLSRVPHISFYKRRKKL